MRKGYYFIILILSTLLTGCLDMVYSLDSKVNAEETRTETFKVANDSDFSIENINGDIKIVSSSNDMIEIVIRKTTSKDKSELANAKVIIDKKSDHTYVKTEYLKKKVKVNVYYTVKLPKKVNLKNVELVNGSVNINDVKGKSIKVECVNGNITVNSVEGNISLESVNGNIDIKNSSMIKEIETVNGSIKSEIRKVADNSEISTVNGSVKLYIDDEANMSLRAETMNGSILIENDKIISKTKKKNKFYGKIGNGKNEMNVSSMNGSIKVYNLN